MKKTRQPEMLRLSRIFAVGSVLALGSSAAFAGPDQGAPKLSWPDLSVVQAAGGGENDSALVVAIERYAFVSPVQNAVMNGADWYAWLTKGRKVPLQRVRLLSNQEATIEEMRKAAAELALATPAGGTVWFVFIGHGAPSQDGKDGVLIGADAQQTAVSLYARSLPQKEVLASLARGKQAHTVAIIDACFSGRSSTGAAIVQGLQPLVVVNSESLRAAPATVLTAAKADQFAGPLPGSERPAFSYLALGGLRGWADMNADGKVTGVEVADYAGQAIRALANDRVQTPEANGATANRPITAGTEKGPDLAALRLQKAGVAARPQTGSADAEWDPSKEVDTLALIHFRSSPPGAMVIVDGQTLCRETPCSKETKPGRHDVTMQRIDYQTRTETTVLENGGTVDWKLKENVARLTIESDPAGVEVKIDAEEPLRTPVSAFALQPGPHTVVVDDACYSAPTQRVEIAAGEEHKMQLPVRPRESAIAVQARNLKKDAIAAEVWLDGKRVGTTPLTMKVPLCTKALELRLGAARWTANLNLRERQVQKVVGSLDPPPGAVAGAIVPESQQRPEKVEAPAEEPKKPATEAESPPKQAVADEKAPSARVERQAPSGPAGPLPTVTLEDRPGVWPIVVGGLVTALGLGGGLLDHFTASTDSHPDPIMASMLFPLGGAGVAMTSWGIARRRHADLPEATRPSLSILHVGLGLMTTGLGLAVWGGSEYSSCGTSYDEYYGSSETCEPKLRSGLMAASGWTALAAGAGLTVWGFVRAARAPSGAAAFKASEPGWMDGTVTMVPVKGGGMFSATWGF